MHLPLSYACIHLARCLLQAPPLAPVEIIELSCCIVDVRALRLTGANFQAYVRPTEHPVLDAFCVELTGIQQWQVDAGQPLGNVLQQLDGWLRQQGLLPAGSGGADAEAAAAAVAATAEEASSSGSQLAALTIKRPATFVPVTWTSWDLKVRQAGACDCAARGCGGHPCPPALPPRAGTGACR